MANTELACQEHFHEIANDMRKNVEVKDRSYLLKKYVKVGNSIMLHLK